MEYQESVPTISSTIASNSTQTFSEAAGYVSCGIAVLFFGSNFVPVKQFETGDGVFFQWLLSSAIFLVGVAVDAYRKFPPFQPLAMLGGWFWATGNLCAVVIIKTIGLSQGLLIWGMFNCLIGWASGTFGWFGLKATVSDIHNKPMNYAGVALAVSSAFVYMFVKSNVSGPSNAVHAEGSGRGSVDSLANDSTADQDHLVGSSSVQRRAGSNILTFRRTPRPTPPTSIAENPPPESGFLDRLSPITKRIIGVGLSMLSGTLYGVNFAPVLYIMEHTTGASQEGLDYVFSHYTGIYLSGTAYFLIYCAVKKNRPDVYPKVILPGFISGFMWAVAQTSWFVANDALSESISFPIITSGPSIVAAVIGILIYKEIQGWKNYVVLFMVFCLAVSGSLLVAFSKS